MKTVPFLLVVLTLVVLTLGVLSPAFGQSIPIQQKRASFGVSLTIVRNDQPEVAREAGVEGPMEVTRIPVADVDAQTRQAILRLNEDLQKAPVASSP
jgi:hypothetical protein